MAKKNPRCIICHKTSDDHDRDGAKWALENDAGGYGVPAVLMRLGLALVCDFCIERMHEEVEAQMATRRTPSTTQAPRPSITTAQRWTVWERDNYTCLHCGARRNLSVDHVIPLARGGAHHERNMQTLCGICNRKKGTTMVVEFR